MENLINNKYGIVALIKQLSKNINLWLCDYQSINYDVLTIGYDEDDKEDIEEDYIQEVNEFRNKDIQGFQKILETGDDENNNRFFIVYEHLDETYSPLKGNKNEAKMSHIKYLAEGLRILKNQNHECFVIEPQYILINSKGEAKLRFLGLYDMFKDNELLNDEYLAPKSGKPNYQDDIYSLVKCFDFLFSESDDYNDILLKSLAKNRQERFSKYDEFIRLLKEEACEKIRIASNASNLGEVIESMNNDGVWFMVESELSKGKQQITGKWSTKNYNGRFFVERENPNMKEERNHIFLGNECYNQPNRKILNSKKAFLLNCNFNLRESNIDVVGLFSEKYYNLNNVADLSEKRTTTINKWQVLPEKEMEYIIETSFKVKYDNRSLCKNGTNNAEFHLIETDNKIWDEIKRFKNEDIKIYTDIPESNDLLLVGKILDFHPKNRTLIIRDLHCTIDEIPPKGELIEDVKQKISQYKKQIDACQEFADNDIVNPSLCSILATPEAEMPYRIKKLKSGELNELESNLFNDKIRNDKSQRNAVFSGLYYKPLYLLQGPPGAGKTTVIIEYIRQILKNDKYAKILITSQSNLAVDNVLEKIKDTEDIDFMRLASLGTLENDNVSPQILPFTYEEKLKKWITQTKKRSEQYFIEHCQESKHEKKKTKCLNSFEELSTLKQDEEDSYLRKLQKRWFRFLDNSTSDSRDGSKKVSMLNNGSEEMDFLTAITKNTSVIGATCIHIASSQYSKMELKFDYVIMDESSKATPAESIVPIIMGRNIILIGDHRQLPPVITREDAVKQKIRKELEDEGLEMNKTFGKSLFEELIVEFEDDDEKKKYVKMLDIQYRMPKQIGDLISKHFYGGKLKTADFEGYEESKKHGLKLKKDTSIVFISTSELPDHYDNGKPTERQNQCNVKAVKEILKILNELCDNNLGKDHPFQIGIIAGYRGQVKLMKNNIRLSDYTNFGKNNIEINTVDKFQGAERDIIIYDVVRSSKEGGHIGFLNDDRRINVAFSRAKRLLVIVGDSDYLIKRAQNRFPDDNHRFELQPITEELEQEGLIFNNINDIFNYGKIEG